ncbi:MAG: response regulator [Dehalococcoidales bacterium]|nr:response regulator [Dehalococcoidales bacterium]
MAKKVLIVEDEPKNMKLVMMVLKPHGYELLSAEDGESAVEIAVEMKPDIILMDMQLPKMSGMDATRMLRGNPDFPDIPIVALTAFAMKGDEEKYLECGCTAYMSKPINTRELPELVTRLLGEE